MWFLFGEMFCSVLVWVGAVYFLYRLWRGSRRVLVDDYLYCRGCGYCLEGMEGEVFGKACVECGAELRGEGDVRKGRRVFVEGKKIWRGVFVLVFCLLWGLGVREISLEDRPTGWLIYELGAEFKGPPAVNLLEIDEEELLDLMRGFDENIWHVDGYQEVWDEVGRRFEAKRLRGDEIDVLINLCLELRDGSVVSYEIDEDSSYESYLSPVRSFLSLMFDKKLMSDEVMLKYLETMFVFEMEGRDRVRGDFEKYRMELELGTGKEVYSDEMEDLGMVIKNRLVAMRFNGEVIEAEAYEKFSHIEVAEFEDDYAVFMVDWRKVFGAGYLKGEGVGEGVLEMEVEMVLSYKGAEEIGRWRVKGEVKVEIVPADVFVVTEVVDESLRGGMIDRIRGVKLEERVCGDHFHLNVEMGYMGKGAEHDWVCDVILVGSDGEIYYEAAYVLKGGEIWRDWDGDVGDGDYGFEDAELMEKNPVFRRKESVVGKKYDVVFRANVSSARNTENVERVWVSGDVIFRGMTVLVDDGKESAAVKAVADALKKVREDILEMKEKKEREGREGE